MRYYIALTTNHEQVLIVAENKQDALDVCFDNALEIKSIMTLNNFTKQNVGTLFLSSVIGVIN